MSGSAGRKAKRTCRKPPTQTVRKLRRMAVICIPGKHLLSRLTAVPLQTNSVARLVCAGSDMLQVRVRSKYGLAEAYAL